MRLCAVCREEKYQAAKTTWTNGASMKRAAARQGITYGAFLHMIQQHGDQLSNRPHSKRKRTKAQVETYRKASIERARRDFLDMPLPIDKLCKGCNRVKPADEFYVCKGKTVGEDGRHSQVLSTKCKVCKREQVKARKERMDPEEFKRERAEAGRRWRERVGREYQNEIAAFKREKKRREQGKERAYAKHHLAVKGQGVKGDVMVPIEPFQKWLRSRAAYYATFEDIVRPEGYTAGLTMLAELCGISDRTFRRFLDGEEMISKGDHKGERRKLEAIPLHTVDSALTREGSTMLMDLYDEADYIYGEATELLEAA